MPFLMGSPHSHHRAHLLCTVSARRRCSYWKSCTSLMCRWWTAWRAQKNSASWKDARYFLYISIRLCIGEEKKLMPFTICLKDRSSCSKNLGKMFMRLLRFKKEGFSGCLRSRAKLRAESCMLRQVSTKLSSWRSLQNWWRNYVWKEKWQWMYCWITQNQSYIQSWKVRPREGHSCKRTRKMQRTSIVQVEPCSNVAWRPSKAIEWSKAQS